MTDLEKLTLTREDLTKSFVHDRPEPDTERPTERVTTQDNQEKGDKMLNGRIETTRTIFCPYCETQEEEDECQQYHKFEFIEIRDDQFQIWECLKCNTIFQIDINEIRF